jgi:hypothetical protein
MTAEKRQQTTEEVYDLLLQELRNGLQQGIPANDLKVLYQLFLAEKELMIAARRLAVSENKERGEKETFGVKEYNEAIDRMMGKAASN